MTLKSHYFTHKSARGFLRLYQGQAAWEKTGEGGNLAEMVVVPLAVSVGALPFGAAWRRLKSNFPFT